MRLFISESCLRFNFFNWFGSCPHVAQGSRHQMRMWCCYLPASAGWYANKKNNIHSAWKCTLSMHNILNFHVLGIEMIDIMFNHVSLFSQNENERNDHCRHWIKNWDPPICRWLWSNHHLMAGFLFLCLAMRRPDSSSATQREADRVGVACVQHVQPSGVSSRPQQSCTTLVCFFGRNSMKCEELPNGVSRATLTH